MLRRLLPNAVAASPEAIDYERLWQLGYRALIFDVDNTLVPHGADATPQVETLMRRLRDMGFRIVLLSDNNRSRVRHFNRHLHLPYIHDAHKPSPRPFRKALQMASHPAKETVVIGDQMFTDILAASRVRIPSILVRYPGYGNRKWPGWHRLAERVLLPLRTLLPKKPDLTSAVIRRNP
jgi:HAD superfamily phosphatase (TIGR01668 family)